MGESASPKKKEREQRSAEGSVGRSVLFSHVMQQLVQSPMALAAMIVCMTHICIASKSLQCHLRWGAAREYRPWTQRALATVGLHGKHTQTAAADQSPVAGHTQVPPKSPAEVAVDVPVLPPPTGMPPQLMFSPPLMSPPAQLGEMAPTVQIPPQYMMGVYSSPIPPPAAGMGAPMHPPPEPVATQTQAGQGMVIPALLPTPAKASSSAGMVELAFGVASGFQAMQTALASLAYNQQLAMYRAQVVPQPTPPPQATPPPRDCIPNCVEYSHQ